MKSFQQLYTFYITYLVMNDKAVFAVEKDAFNTVADAEEGIDDKWLKLAENLLEENPIKK